MCWKISSFPFGEDRDVKIKEVTMKGKRRTNQENATVQLKESSAADNQLNSKTENSGGEVKVEFYKRVQALRREIRMQAK